MKVLFCGPNLQDEIIQYFIRLLNNHQVITCTKEHLLQHVKDIDILIPWGASVDEALMKRGAFGFIQQPGVGLEKIDIDAATRNGIWVARAPSTETGNADSVAEHALMLMLMLSRHFPESQRILKSNKIGAPSGQALGGKKAVIIGLGGIGSALAKRLSCLNMEVSGVHEYPERGIPEGVSTLFGLPDRIKAVCDADYVILCLNYTSFRHHLIGLPELQAMKQGAFIVNIARGGLLDHNALRTELQKGHLAGAGLDVFWKEPVDPNDPLFQENVIATPHIAGITDISYRGNARLVAENIQRYSRGERPLFVVNDPYRPRRRK